MVAELALAIFSHSLVTKSESRGGRESGLARSAGGRVEEVSSPIPTELMGADGARSTE